MRLSTTARAVLLDLMRGGTLKSHRTLDGQKRCLLYPSGSTDGDPVSGEAVIHLHEAGLIASNKKFPVATYLLTEKGWRLAAKWSTGSARPLTARGWQ